MLINKLRQTSCSCGGSSCSPYNTYVRVLATRSALTGLAAELERVPAPEEVWSLEDMEGAQGALALVMLRTVISRACQTGQKRNAFPMVGSSDEH